MADRMRDQLNKFTREVSAFGNSLDWLDDMLARAEDQKAIRPLRNQIDLIRGCGERGMFLAMNMVWSMAVSYVQEELDRLESSEEEHATEIAVLQRLLNSYINAGFKCDSA